MDTMRDIRMRLKSINNTKQITESMRLISTRKVQRVRTRMGENKPYLEQTIEVVHNLANEYHYKRHRYITGHGAGRPLILLITGDRGFCGGYNTNAAKEAFALYRKLGDAQIITIGTKGRDYFRRRQIPILEVIRGLSENPFHEDARGISGVALNMFNEGEASEVWLVSTEYQTMILQAPKYIRLLPLIKGADEEEREITLLSDKEAYIQQAISSYVSSVLFGAMLESAVCEQCARVMSMDSAVKNAEKMIENLTLQYNQMRQGDITQEIAEVVGGANVVGQK